MCGINGIVSENSESLLDVIHTMIRTQHHRGPDENGLYQHKKCLLGHNRLSIVDLGTGQQPMTSADGRYTIVFNGEIYGYKKLKNNLSYPFKTQSDTEVILAMYIEHGPAMLAQLPGMFAFAIWDAQSEELFIARDRIGEKPFYYSLTDKKELVFASELQTLAASGLIDLAINMDSVGHFLSKLYVHPNHSIYKNIQALPAGHYGIFKNGQLNISSYWQPFYSGSEITYLEAIEEIELLFSNAIKDQLIADVPVSVFLSGGLDSSTVAAYAHKENANVDALSFRFRSGFDEGSFAHDVANMHKIKIREIWENKNHNLVDLFHKSVDCYGEPFADSSSIPTMLICESAVKYSKVVLSGDGADELFGGYISRYRPTIYMQKMLGKNTLRLQAERYLNGFLNKVHFNETLFNKSQAAKYLLQGRSIEQALDQANSIYKDEELSLLGLSRQQPIWTKNKNDVNGAMFLDMQNYLPGDILVKTDRASMQVGLEVRAPFLAKEIMDFACALPASFKITTDDDKKIMRDAFSKEWPASVKSRSKQGFGSPVAAWLNDSAMRDLHATTFSSNAKIYNYLDRNFVDANKDDTDMRGWAMLNLAVWLERQANI